MAHIFWDFDGTLVHSSPLWRGAMLKALDRMSPGHSVTLNALKSLVAVGFPWHSEEPHDLVSPVKWWMHMNEKFARDFESLGIERGQAVKASALIRESILNPVSYQIFPEVREILTSLSDAGWKHVVLSNNHPDLDEVIEGLGLHVHFDHVITSANVGHEKPRSEIFEHALQISGADVSSSWMVGDSLRADIMGAERVGLRAVLVRTMGEAKWTARDLTEVSRIIQS